ncbi:MAG: cyclic nucleotide-binding domain-containing protein, partial [Deltaproteobacteria bacterium]|nr:cyclic nucleotide-binding domain-containing protein [Deltaproteobacteria bacterium]
MVKTDSKPHCHQCAVRFGGVLCALKEEPLLELDHHKTVNRYKKGQIIFYEGNEPFGLYCINAGRVKLYKSGEEGRNQIVRIAGPGDLLGYRSLFAEEPYQATAEVMEEAEICCIDRNVFFPILAKNPELS